MLFGSRARGDAFEDSDYDLLLGLRREDHARFIDRIGTYQDTESGRVQVFPYSPSEFRAMAEQDHLLLLEALADGVVLHDRGAWNRLRTEFIARRASGGLERVPGGWIVRS